MRTRVEFRSDKFPAYPGEDREVNPGLWGKRLAEYLHQKLREQGIETAEIFAEDWGWAVTLRHEAFPMWVGCGHYQEYQDGYLASKPTVRKGLFKKIDATADIEKVIGAIDRILRSDPDIHDIRWWAENEK